MLYDRYARDLSQSLFDSVYVDMYRIAERCQINANRNTVSKGWKCVVTEEQETFNKFCHNKLSLGDALDFIKINKKND
jgi:hypothetical protein